jgi:hypothetical protein
VLDHDSDTVTAALLPTGVATTVSNVARTRRRDDFITFLQRELDRTRLNGRELSRQADLNVNEVGSLLNADHGPSIATLVRLGNYLQWDWTEVIALFGGARPEGVKQVATTIAARKPLLELFEVARKLDADQLRMLRLSAAAWLDGKAADRD